MKLMEFFFIVLHSSVFGKVRELVGEVKYAALLLQCKPCLDC